MHDRCGGCCVRVSRDHIEFGETCSVIPPSGRVHGGAESIDVVPSSRRLFRADLVIEAIVEDLDAKQQLFDQLYKAAAKECIFVSNTGSLSIGEVGSRLAPNRRKRQTNRLSLPHRAQMHWPGGTCGNRFGGLHFFNSLVSTDHFLSRIK